MAYTVGVFVALVVAALARWSGFDRDRAFYSTVVVVVASYYVLFAAMSGSMETVLTESLVMTPFVIAAGIGFRWNMWIVAVALAAHGVLDSVHARVVLNSGVPTWWP